MTDHIVLPLLIPLLTGIITLLLGARRTRARLVSVAGTTAGLGYAIFLLVLVWQEGIQVSNVGGWPLPFGIALTVDLLSAIMLSLSALMGWVVLLYTFCTLDEPRERFAFYPLFHFLLLGVNGAFLTGDLFNLYVWFEVMLIASFGLMTLGGERDQLEGGLKYVVINLVSSTFFLIAVGLIYGAAGTLNMAHLAEVLSGALPDSRLISALAMLFLLSFGIKAAIFPLFFWLPASYHTPPVAVTALFGGLLTKVGVYAMYRVFTLLFVGQPPYINDLLLTLAGMTMVVGVLGAIAQNNVRRILSFHIISQIGYMIMGLALYTPLALIGSVFYIVHHIIVKTNLFLVGGLAQKLTGSYELKKMGGLYRHYPWLGVLFLIPAFSLAGFPPLSGFWAKFTLIYASLQIGQFWIAGVALLVGLLTLFSMTKIWMAAFWTPLPGYENDDTGSGFHKLQPRDMFLLVFPIVTLATLTIIIGLFPEPFYELSLKAAEDLLDPTNYINAVLGK